MRRPLSYQEALARLAQKCSTTEICRSYVREKAASWGLTADEATRMIEWLEGEKFIDEHRYAAAFARDKHRFSGWGKIKIAFALKGKGIPSDIVSEAVDALPDEQTKSKLTDLLSAKLKTIKYTTSFEARTKLYRFAASRGFTVDEISDAVAEVLKGANEED